MACERSSRISSAMMGTPTVSECTLTPDVMLQTSRISAGVTPRASAARTSLVRAARSRCVTLAFAAIATSATTRGLSTPDTRAAPAQARNRAKNSGSDLMAAAAPSSQTPKTCSYSARS